MAQEPRVTCSRKRTMQKRVVGSYETSLHITVRVLITNFWALTPSYGLQIAFSKINPIPLQQTKLSAYDVLLMFFAFMIDLRMCDVNVEPL